jgi:hypothetical protein
LGQIGAGSAGSSVRNLIVAGREHGEHGNQKHYPERILVSQSPHHFHVPVLGAADPLIAAR